MVWPTHGTAPQRVDTRTQHKEAPELIRPRPQEGITESLNGNISRFGRVWVNTLPPGQIESPLSGLLHCGQMPLENLGIFWNLPESCRNVS